MGTQESFLLRWRGRQEGPYALKVIQRKLAAGEIGLLHEVLFKGRWRALRDYLAEEEATRQAKLLAQREAERLAKEAERKAREIRGTRCTTPAGARARDSAGRGEAQE